MALLIVTRRMGRRHTRDGVVLGAAVGFGFAASESAGYAFEVLISSGGSLLAMVQTELLRGALAPLGHGLWTAILGGVVFRRINRVHGETLRHAPARFGDACGLSVVAAYLGVAVLHALWDSMARSVLVLQVQLVGLAVVSLVGLGGLTAVWVRGRREPVPLR